MASRSYYRRDALLRAVEIPKAQYVSLLRRDVTFYTSVLADPRFI